MSLRSLIVDSGVWRHLVETQTLLVVAVANSRATDYLNLRFSMTNADSIGDGFGSKNSGIRVKRKIYKWLS